MKKEIVHYTQYNVWANERISSILSKLSDEQLERELVSSFGSLRKTLLHIWDAESLWLERLKGKNPTEFPSKHFKGDNKEAFKLLSTGSRAFSQFVARQNVSFLKQEIETRSMAGIAFQQPAYNYIHHCMNHSTFHRGQLITLARQVGLDSFQSIDFTTYCREKKA